MLVISMKTSDARVKRPHLLASISVFPAIGSATPGAPHRLTVQYVGPAVVSKHGRVRQVTSVLDAFL